jgi:hypothetical protein
MQAGDDAAEKLLAGAAHDLLNAEQKLAVAAANHISDTDDKAEVELLGEEAADVRVRIAAATARLAKQ